MSVDRASRLFLDATCLFATSHSPRGGSAFIVLVCIGGYSQAIVSPYILIEAERNLLAKSTAEAFIRYRQLVASTLFHVTSAPDETTVREHESTFFEDAHVVASALDARADYLLTLDQRLERRIAQARLPIVSISLRTFIQQILPRHPDYMLIRDTLR